MRLRKQLIRIYRSRWFFGGQFDDYSPELREHLIKMNVGSLWDRQSKPRRILFIVVLVVPNLIHLIKLL